MWRLQLKEAASLKPISPLDFVFLDADHSYRGTREAIWLWSTHVRDGGLICGHDYRRSYPGVIKAVDEARQGRRLLLSTGTVWGFLND